MSALTLAVDHDAEATSIDVSRGWALSVSLDRTDGFRVAGGAVARRGSLTGFFDGILFDRGDLQRSFRLPQSATNADLVLAAYERDGEACLSRLRGQFAVAIADPREDRVLVARDPIGQHPLFFGVVNGTVYFARDTATLIDGVHVPGALNIPALADHLCHRWPYRDETFFQHIRRVPPGWRALVSHGDVRLRRYWDPVPADQPIEWLTESEVAGFDEVFARAIARCFEHDDRLGIFLSGGIDSVSVAAGAADYARARHLPAPIALSLGFDRSPTDERHIQEPIARRLGLPFVFMDFSEAVGDENVLVSALEMTQGLSSPTMSAWPPAYMRLAARGHQQGVRTILDGHGGDEWLSISPYLAADLIRRGDFAAWRQLYRVMRRSFAVSGSQALRDAVWTYGLRPLAGAGLDRLAPGWWQKNRASRVRNHDYAWVAPGADLARGLQARAEATLAPSLPSQGFYANELQTTIDHALLSWDREERYECGRRVGVDFVHPYMDPDVIAHLWRTPPAALNQGDVAKGLVRTKLAARFPQLGFDGQRKLSATPYYRQMLQKHVPGAVAAVGKFPALAARGLVDADGADRFVRATLDGGATNLHRIWDLLHLEVWVRAHGN